MAEKKSKKEEIFGEEKKAPPVKDSDKAPVKSTEKPAKKPKDPKEVVKKKYPGEKVCISAEQIDRTLKKKKGKALQQTVDVKKFYGKKRPKKKLGMTLVEDLEG